MFARDLQLAGAVKAGWTIGRGHSSADAAGDHFPRIESEILRLNAQVEGMCAVGLFFCNIGNKNRSAEKSLALLPLNSCLTIAKQTS
ncbi:MAG: hypothetical protein C4324_09485 [Blastocatellia bacterium]